MHGIAEVMWDFGLAELAGWWADGLAEVVGRGRETAASFRSKQRPWYKKKDYMNRKERGHNLGRPCQVVRIETYCRVMRIHRRDTCVVSLFLFCVSLLIRHVSLNKN